MYKLIEIEGFSAEYDPESRAAIRDGYMAENINWILEQEERLGNNRIWQSPETLYDGMIYISKAHPTKIMPEQ